MGSLPEKNRIVGANPKILETRVVVNPPAKWLGARNAILWGKAKRYYVPDFPGPLSVKSVVRGSARWTTSEAGRLVDESTYLVLNSGQRYTMAIDSRELVETFCLFFRRGLVEEVARVQASDPEELLDDPARDTMNPGGVEASRVAFFETLRMHDAQVSPLLRQLYSRLKNNSAGDLWLEDQFWAVASAMCRMHGDGAKQAAVVPAKKHSTRVELYGRLLRGKDFMDSFLEQPLHLREIAGQACLSPYHFHRLFREVFRETPNQYLQRKRLANATRLLASTDRSITDICLNVGFESVTSFSGLFRRNFGCSPREYRLQNTILRHRH
jgi:AraC family transcriptional regulator